MNKRFSLNRPTARLITTILLDAAAHDAADQQAEDAVLMLAGAFTNVPYGRQRMWNALSGFAPRLAGLLQNAQVDIRWVNNVDRRHIAAVRREIEKANAWMDEHGTVPCVCVALNTSTIEASWPPRLNWRRAVWELVNAHRRSRGEE